MTGRVEDHVHKAVLTWIRRAAPQCLPYHTPNGGYRGRMEAVRLKALGVRPGVPDITVLVPGGRAVFLEIKPEKGGTVRPEQKAFRNEVEALGFGWALVRSIDNAREAFAAWGIPTRERRA